MEVCEFMPFAYMQESRIFNSWNKNLRGGVEGVEFGGQGCCFPTESLQKGSSGGKSRDQSQGEVQSC